MAGYQKRYPALQVDVEAELHKYQVSAHPLTLACNALTETWKRAQRLAERIRPLVKDTVFILWDAIRQGDKKILIEGANALMLDIDFGEW